MSPGPSLRLRPDAGESGAILEVENLSVNYGAVSAVRGISLTLQRGEIVTLIGANGAGKSTTLRAIMGLVVPASGSVRLRGRSITGRPTFKIVRDRMTLVPEGRAVFANLTVRENLELGAYARRAKHIDGDLDNVFAAFPRLKERIRQRAGTLSGGEQQMLAIGRALMSQPDVLLLDEPSLGLAPMLVQTIFESIEAINRQGASVLLVEQNANAALKHSRRAYVLETGSVTLSGPSARIAEDPRVKEAYLGE
jgi:branched-chain amino acid transport system ATP-binding protein